MTKFGFKKITQNNWLEPDPVLRGFVRISPDGRSQGLTGDDYLNLILKPKLLESVPTEVQALFEVARGAMVYAYFFYPLYSLAAEQLFRVAESAIGHKCEALGAPKLKGLFKRRIDWLVDKGTIPGSELNRWETIRELRNAASHPDRQSIFTPGNAIGLIEGISEQINSICNQQLNYPQYA